MPTVRNYIGSESSAQPYSNKIRNRAHLTLSESLWDENRTDILGLSHRGADVKLFPACRNESRFVLSIKPDPVSTKLGTGA